MRVRAMNAGAFNRASHFSVVWAVMLSFITIVEWRSLDRDPLKAEILSPFITRHIEIVPGGAPPGGDSSGSARPINSLQEQPAAGPQTTVELGFNGPFFLACFFIPIILFHGLGNLLTYLQQRSKS